MLVSHISPDMIGKEISLQGWIAHSRSSGKIAFVELRDGSGYIQCIVEQAKVGDQLFDEITSLGIESALAVTGLVAKHPKKEEFELHVTHAEILSIAKDFPLGQKDDHGVDFLFDMRHLYLRAKSQRAIQRVRDTIIHATYDWMRHHDYTKIDAPIFTPTCAEDSTSLYETKHTNDELMYLTQTGQMYIEAAIAGHRNVYDFGPVFRAERSKTRRHLNELWMMDAETAFCDNAQNMIIQESLIKFIVSEVLRLRANELTLLGREKEKLQKTVDQVFLRKTHAEVVQELQQMGSDIQAGEDLGADDEKMLMEKYEIPLFVTNFPLEIKAFYMPEDPAHPGTAKCADLLAPEGYGEVIGGSERLGDYESLRKRIVERGYEMKDYEWYLDIRKYGGVTTSGFGFGLERLVMWICGLEHIREAIPFPRYHNRITP